MSEQCGTCGKASDECRCPEQDAGAKHDSGKKDWSLLPWESLGHVVDVLMDGANKYSRDNWKKVPKHRARYFAAAMRHLIAWWCGEKRDPRSGLPTLAHAICCILFLLARDEEAQ